MKNLQQDVLDVNARYIKPIIAQLARDMKDQFSAD